MNIGCEWYIIRDRIFKAGGGIMTQQTLTKELKLGITTYARQPTTMNLMNLVLNGLTEDDFLTYLMPIQIEKGSALTQHDVTHILYIIDNLNWWRSITVETYRLLYNEFKYKQIAMTDIHKTTYNYISNVYFTHYITSNSQFIDELQVFIYNYPNAQGDISTHFLTKDRIADVIQGDDSQRVHYYFLTIPNRRFNNRNQKEMVQALKDLYDEAVADSIIKELTYDENS